MSNTEFGKYEAKNPIGIDLGTTFSCCAASINGTVEIISNTDGNRTTPSIVGYGDDGSIAIGQSAMSLYATNPSSVVFDTKRMIGRSFDDPEIQSCIKNWPFEVVRYDFKQEREEKCPPPPGETVTDNIAIKIMKNGKIEYLPPIIISARILRYMVQSAEQRLGSPVDAAVVTIPAYFGTNHKAKTREAAFIAGFNEKNVALLSEPTAAAMSYARSRLPTGKFNEFKEKILVFDLGGGTFDVSVVEFLYDEKGTMGDVHGIDGDNFLGGVDFDNKLMDFAIQEFCRKNRSVKPEDITETNKIRLRAEVSKVKAVLSSTTSSTIHLACFHGSLYLDVPITRSRFEMLCDPLFKKCMERVKGCLAEYKKVKDIGYNKIDGKLQVTNEMLAKIEEAKAEIDKVIPVGGSSRIPKIKAMLADFFGANKIVEPVNPDEAVAYGACLHADSIFYKNSGDDNQVRSELILSDCCPLDLSIETAGGVATVLIPRNSAIPVKKEETFTTYSDNQTAVTINVYEGNRSLAKENCRIGSFNLDGIMPAPRGVPKIKVIFDMDSNGVLKITAIDEQTSKQSGLTVSNTQSRLSDEEVKRMRQVAAEHEKADEEIRRKINKKNGFESVINGFRSALEQNPQLTQEAKDSLFNQIKPYENYVYGINGADYDEAEFDAKEKEVRDLIQSSMPGAGQQPQ